MPDAPSPYLPGHRGEGGARVSCTDRSRLPPRPRPWRGHHRAARGDARRGGPHARHRRRGPDHVDRGVDREGCAGRALALLTIPRTTCSPGCPPRCTADAPRDPTRPRRAVGPDLVALVFGAAGDSATLDRAWLRVRPATQRRRQSTVTTKLLVDLPVPRRRPCSTRSPASFDNFRPLFRTLGLLDVPRSRATRRQRCASSVHGGASLLLHRRGLWARSEESAGASADLSSNPRSPPRTSPRLRRAQRRNQHPMPRSSPARASSRGVDRGASRHEALLRRRRSHRQRRRPPRCEEHRARQRRRREHRARLSTGPTPRGVVPQDRERLGDLRRSHRRGRQGRDAQPFTSGARAAGAKTPAVAYAAGGYLVT